MGAGYVGILSAELHFPENGSLKGKRKELLSLKAQLQRRFGASVAEVDHHELWQRSRVTLSCVARGHRELAELLDGFNDVKEGDVLEAYETREVERTDLDTPPAAAPAPAAPPAPAADDE